MPCQRYHPNTKSAREHLQDLLTHAHESTRQVVAKEREKARRAEAEAEGDVSLSCVREVRLCQAMQ
eukprot:4073544-Pyramimonas_sp.AAC.1